MDYVNALEKALKKAKINFLPLQQAMFPTLANVDELKKNLIISPQHLLLMEYQILLNGIKNFIKMINKKN